MMQAKLAVFVGVPVLAVGALVGGATYALGGTQSTTGLDQYSAVTVDGHKALGGNLVAGRIKSKYHPLPWIGGKVGEVSCPTGLKAVTGTKLTCTGHVDGRTFPIPVTVVEADATSITWKFDR